MDPTAPFERLLENEANRARRHGRKFGLLLVEPDGADPRNGEEIAGLLAKALRNYDGVAPGPRGVEILVCDAGREELRAVAERILGRIRAARATASIGGAVFPDDAVATSELRARAAEALARARSSGDRYEECAASPAPATDRAAEMDRLVQSRSGRTVVAMVSKILREGGDVEAMLRRTLELMAKAVEADRGLLFLLQDGARLRAVLNMPDRAVELESDDYSTSVLRRAISSAQPVRVADVERDSWASGLASVQGLGMTSILAVPILSGGKVLGAVYLDSRRRDRRFAPEDEDLLLTFAGLIARPVEQGAELKRRAEEVSRLQDVVRSGLTELGKRHSFGSIVGRSAAMREVFTLIERVAPSPYPVIVCGETGTGKELVAKAVHFNSPRKTKPFLPVNCGAIAETLLESHLFGHVKGAFTGADQSRPGLFEAADGGTLFLDEIEEMSDGMQKKLLRVLEESQVWPVGARESVKVDVRILAATNEEVRDLLEEGRLRQDLNYRLNTYHERLPPLRQRAEDLPLLVEHFVGEIAEETKAQRLRISQGAMALFLRYPWPGNVRELRNELRKLSVLAGGEIRPEDLPAHIRETTGSIGRDSSLREQLGEVDRKLIVEALDRNDWNISRTAEDLGINRNTLKTRMRKHGIRKSER
ncbi:MAG: sigma 54-interacting transcriptional regulator [Planctomycetes bacterium]|nr:sigma 54-interacting transcriptional regulator [Planctomycetota bacterium]